MLSNVESRVSVLLEFTYKADGFSMNGHGMKVGVVDFVRIE